MTGPRDSSSSAFPCGAATRSWSSSACGRTRRRSCSRAACDLERAGRPAIGGRAGDRRPDARGRARPARPFQRPAPVLAERAAVHGARGARGGRRDPEHPASVRDPGRRSSWSPRPGPTSRRCRPTSSPSAGSTPTSGWFAASTWPPRSCRTPAWTSRPEEVQEMISTSVNPETVLMNVTVTDTSPRRSLIVGTVDRRPARRDHRRAGEPGQPQRHPAAAALRADAEPRPGQPAGEAQPGPRTAARARRGHRAGAAALPARHLVPDPGPAGVGRRSLPRHRLRRPGTEEGLGPRPAAAPTAAGRDHPPAPDQPAVRADGRPGHRCSP